MPATRRRLSSPCLLTLCLLPAAALASCTANYRSKPGSGLQECAATDAGCTACYEIPGSNDFCQESLDKTLSSYCSTANASSLSADDRFACLYWLLCNQSPDQFICEPGGAFVFSLFFRIPGENGGGGGDRKS